MEGRNFTVTGKMTLGNEERTFSKSVSAMSETHAREKAYSLLGAANGLSRNKIMIEKVEKG